MRDVYTVFAAALFLGLSSTGTHAQTEQPKYKVIERIGSGIEIRSYGPRTVARVEVPLTEAGGTSRQAFRILAAYIFGKNRAKAKIAMTAPVKTERTSEKISMTAPVKTQATAGMFRMAFYLPAKYSVETAPDPIDQRIKISTVAPTTIATIRYSGVSREADKARQWRLLKAKVDQSKWRVVGKPFFYGYDPPWTPASKRRNEVGVMVEAK
jgi:hypothetical protein